VQFNLDPEKFAAIICRAGRWSEKWCGVRDTRRAAYPECPDAD
jgi:hypothetical protein